ncbi:hypothetical protein R6Q59_023445 [Mikania micrantha]
MGRGSSHLAGGRGVGRGNSQGVGQGSDRGVVQGGSQGVGQGSNRGVVRGGSQGAGQGSDQGFRRGNSLSVGQSSDRGVVRGSYQDASQGSDQGVGRGNSHGVGRCSSQCVGQGSDHGIGRRSGIDSNDTVLPSSIEGNDDDDDESTFHSAHTRRGHASQVQVPEPMNREWIWIEDGEFSNQEASTRIIGVILKAMWNGPWDSWRDVSNEDRKQFYFQWEEKWNASICRHWDKCIARKFPDLLRRVRNEAKETTRKQGLEVGDDMSVVVDFKPPWIRTDIWKQMIGIWNTPEWKAKSKRNSDIKSKSIRGKHTLGSQTYMTAKRKALFININSTFFRLRYSDVSCNLMRCGSNHIASKGSRPLDKDLSCSSSLVSDVDSEENIEEENLVWVDDRAKETWDKYDGYLVEKYGDERGKHPKFDKDLWSRAAGGKNKEKVYGLSSVNDSNTSGRKDPENEKLNEIIKEILKEKEEEKED